MGKKNQVQDYTPGNFKALGLCTPYDKKGGTCIITALDPEYVRVRDEAKRELTLPDGRTLAYTLQGEKTATSTLIIAQHGGTEGKAKFLQRKPMDGIQLASIDRPGYGDSTSAPLAYNFDDVRSDVMALCRELGYEQFITMGHSIGGFWCQQIAAGLPDNCRGAIMFSPVADLSVPGGEKYMKSVGRPPAPLHPRRGCCKCILASVFQGVAKTGSQYDFRQNVHQEDGSGKVLSEGFKKFVKDPFWISTKIESWQGMKPGQTEGILTDAEMCLFAGTHGTGCGKTPGHLDPRTIKCPIYQFHGEYDCDLGTNFEGAGAWAEELWGSKDNFKFEKLEGVGHTFGVTPNEDCQALIMKAVATMPPL